MLKVENPNWKSEKTLNEVTALKYLSSNTSIPVPKIIAYENTIESSPLKYEYILMTHMRGVPLNHEFDRIYSNPLLYQLVLEQLADVLAQLKQQPFLAMGCIKETTPLSLKCPIDFASLSYDTSCQSFSEYARRWLAYYIQEMKSLKKAGHQNSAYFERYISLAEQMICSPNWSRLDVLSEKFSFSHQDFVMKNILIEDATITAVLDWEWSGATVVEFEAKTGCDFLKSPQDFILFNTLLEQRGITDFFKPPSPIRQLFYKLMGELYTLISCYEWVEGKLEHSAKFLDQKLEQRRIRNTQNFDMKSYVEEISILLDSHFTEISQELI